VKTACSYLLSAGVFLVITVGIPALLFLVFKQEFLKFLAWNQNHKLAGGFLYAMVLTLTATICIPTTPFELAAGYLFGFIAAIPISLTGKVLGSLISFALGKYVLFSCIKSWSFFKTRLFKGLEHAIKSKPWHILTAARLSALPLSIKNYGLSVLGASWLPFSVTTLLGSIPFTLTWSQIGSLSKDIQQASSGGHRSSVTEWVLMSVGILSCLVLMLMLRKYAAEEMNKVALLDQNTDESVSEDQEIPSGSTVQVDI